MLEKTDIRGVWSECLRDGVMDGNGGKDKRGLWPDVGGLRKEGIRCQNQTDHRE